MYKRIAGFENVGYTDGDAKVAERCESIPHERIQLKSLFETGDGLFLVVICAMESSKKTKNCRRIRKSGSSGCAMLP
jgi:hypothetical protein